MKKTILALLLLCFVFSVDAQKYYSFEDKVPGEWNNVTNGTLGISGNHFKQGRKSLQWNWNSGSVITVNNPASLSQNCKNVGSAIWAWVYNATPRTDSLRFDFSNQTGKVLAGFNFGLNFSGWRFMWVCFGHDLGYLYSEGNELTTMLIHSPANGNGILFFDMVETVPTSSINWHRSSDMQYTVKENGAAAAERVDSYTQNVNTQVIDLNDTVTANLIEKRLQNWFLGSNVYKGWKNYDVRYAALLSKINQVKNSGNSMNQQTLLIRQADNTVIALSKKDSSGIGLNGDMIGYKPMFNDVNTGWIFEMAMDVALKNGSDKKQLQRTIDILDWMYDQGYAEGSGLGTGLTQLRSGGFPFAFFLMRKYLSPKQYDRYLKTVRWIAINNYHSPGRSADEIRGASISKLIYTLCVKDPVERLAELRSFKNYMDNAVAIAPGYFGLVKPDYSVYHHNMPYYSEYGDDAIHQTAIILYLMRDSKFSLSETSFKNIRNAVMNITDISAGYIVPASVSGRFPSGAKGVTELIPALAYIGLSAPEKDEVLINAFNRLYRPENPDVIKIFQSSGLGIQYTTSLGSIIALNDFEQKVKAGPKSYTFSKYLPFSGLFVATQNDWTISVKGFSKYLIDFECITTDGRFSRYCSYGHMQIISPSRAFNSYLPDKSFDWVHYPASTAINLALDKIDTRKPGNNSKERNFGDETFLGGVSLSEKQGMFSMLLHDNVFDRLFRAKKSVFYFGNLIYFMGSGINCSDAQNETHTTLFQNISGDELSVNKQLVEESSAFSQKAEKPQIIKNSWGNTYIVFPGDNLLSVQKRIQATTDCTGKSTEAQSYEIAWLNHGTKPQNAKYNYALLMEPDKITTAALLNTNKPCINIMQQDNIAHIICNTIENTYCYAFFSSVSNLNLAESIISSVSKPCIIMLQKQKNGSIDIVLSDPDLNRPAYTGDKAETAGKTGELDIYLVGKYTTQQSNESSLSLSYANNSTRIKAIVKEGAPYKLRLLKK